MMSGTDDPDSGPTSGAESRASGAESRESRGESRESRGASAPPSDRPATPSQRSSHSNKKSKKGKSGDSTRPCREHTFLTDVADVREMEQGLLQLLDDFHSGKLQSFGNDFTFEKLDQVRLQQEQLARLHFELDSQQESLRLESEESRQMARKHMDKLMEKLQELNTSIADLQKSEGHPSIQKHRKSGKSHKS